MASRMAAGEAQRSRCQPGLDGSETLSAWPPITMKPCSSAMDPSKVSR